MKYVVDVHVDQRAYIEIEASSPEEAVELAQGRLDDFIMCEDIWEPDWDSVLVDGEELE